MDLKYDMSKVIESLSNKLADAEKRASQFEAVAIFKENKIKGLENELKELKKNAE